MTPDPQSTIIQGSQRASWIRVRTMILIRWIAIAGQIIAIVVADQVYNIRLEIGWCLLAIGISVVMNVTATIVYPETKRLSALENMGLILFDLFQLSALLYLTGGLHNPFSILLLAPVVIASSVLPIRLALGVGVAAMVLATLLGFYYIPLQTRQFFHLKVADLFLYGNWVAMMVAFVFLSIYARRVTQEMNTMSDALFATQMALEREQKLTDLGGVIAAAAHELGTPLATIKLTSAELIDELEDHPELQQDAQLIRDQADRCRDIMRAMGRAGKDDKHMRFAPLQEVVESAAKPHQDRGVDIEIFVNPDANADRHPIIQRRAEIIHGLRNMVQNAVDFAEKQVLVEIQWTPDAITVRIMDDGQGFPPEMISRIGDPFVRRRKSPHIDPDRPGYEGMGLGLFIAKTLLERTGATLVFANGTAGTQGNASLPQGAVVEIRWPREQIEQHSTQLGENTLIV